MVKMIVIIMREIRAVKCYNEINLRYTCSYFTLSAFDR